MSRTQLFLIFFSILITLIGLMQWYLFASYRRWVRRAFLGRGARWVRVGRWVLATGNALFALSFLVRGALSSMTSVRDAIVYPAGIWLATVLLSFLVVAIKDVIRLAVFWVRHGARVLQQVGQGRTTTVTVEEAPEDDERRRFLRVAGTATIGLVAAAPVAASLSTARDYQIRRIPLYAPNLPDGLEGLTVAQISDIHSGVYMSRRDMEHIVVLVNELTPDLTVVTGDLVDTNDTEIEPMRNALRGLRADLGVYGILGNHDHFASADKVAAAAEDAGIRMLVNRHTTLTIGGSKLSLVGVDDPSRGRNFADLPAALDGLERDSFKVMLAHQPGFWDRAKKAGMDLTLVGHTHGGQIGMELLGMKLYPVRLAYDHPMGHYIEDGTQMYVNVGVGMVAVPIRMVRPEIALFELRRGEPRQYVPPTV